MLFVFDWDGTISDSAAKIVDCMQTAATRAGEDAQTDAAIRNIIGLGMPEALLALYPEASEERKTLIYKHYSDYFKEKDAVPSPFFAGAKDTMSRLKEQGFYIAVATGKSRAGLDRVLKTLGMSDFFHTSRCADETASKPHPLMLQEILDELGVSVSQAVMVGDTEYDMDMAEQINMKRIAVSYGAHNIERLQHFNPSLCVDTFSDIEKWRF